MIDLGKEEWGGEGANPWNQILELPDQTSRSLLPSQPIEEVFNEVGRSLLILGAPGSGKTVTLLELARDLVRRAEDDPSQPMPVVFNLSSWAEERLPLFDWLVEELRSKYRVPKKVGRSWLGENWLLPLLDGLDEVRSKYRNACLEAINKFVAEHGVSGLVVCSRLDEYTALPERLESGGAIRLQPLTPEQVNEYVESFGSALEGLGVALKKDRVLQTLAETPLMLGVMSLAYQGADDTLAEQQASSQRERRDQIFSRYVDRVFQRKGVNSSPFGRREVLGRLSWLAKEMRDHSQSVFAVEELQPSWLGSTGQRASYGVLAAVIIGLSYALIFGLFGVPELASVARGTLTFAPMIVLGVLLGSWSASPLRNGVVIGLLCVVPYALITSDVVGGLVFAAFGGAIGAGISWSIVSLA